MKHIGIPVVIVTIFILAGLAANAVPAASAPRIEIAGFAVERPEMVQVKTGGKVKMSDGDQHQYYENYQGTKDTVLLTVVFLVAVDGAPDTLPFDANSVQLRQPGSGDAPVHRAFARFEDPDWVEMGEAPVIIASRAELEFAFEVPAKEWDSLVLSVGGFEMGPVSGLLKTSSVR